MNVIKKKDMSYFPPPPMPMSSPPQMPPPPPQMMMMPQSQSDDNSGALIVGVVLFIGVVVFLVWWFMYRKVEGEKCTPETEEKVTDADTYKYDANGNCVVANCLASYSLSANACFKDMDCAIEWPTKFIMKTSDSTCSQTATVKTTQSGSGKACPASLTRSFPATDANCIALKIMTDMAANDAVDTLVTLFNDAATPVAVPLKYGSTVWSSSLARISPDLSNTVPSTGTVTSKMITFAAAGAPAGSNNITHNSNVLIISIPDMCLLKPTSTGVLSNTTPAVIFSSTTNYSAETYNDYKFMTSNSATGNDLILTSRIKSSTTFTIPLANILTTGLSFTTSTDPTAVTGYTLGSKNSSCTNGAIIGTESTTYESTYSTCASECGTDCTAFQYIPGTTDNTKGNCNKYSGAGITVTQPDYTSKTGLSDSGYCSKKNPP